jgi:two-component sensor histidine kinase
MHRKAIRMNEAAVKQSLPGTAVVTLVAVALIGGILLAIGPGDYPNLHTILDTSLALMLGMAALQLWDMGQYAGNSFPKWLAVTCAVTFVLAIIHVLVTVEWSGELAVIGQSKGFLRPATWPPGTHLLPIGAGWALWRKRRGVSNGVLSYALVIIALAVGLFVAFQHLPTYLPPGPLGITRPALVLAPLLWAGVGIAAWRLRALDRLVQPLFWMAGTLVLANIVMLYSRAPADGPAMVAHLGRVGGFLVLLLSAMHIASRDMYERIRAETALAQLNESLDRRVAEQTSALLATTRDLEIVVEERTAALQQRDILLREVYHRVKNNLQIIDSLLVMQARQLTDSDAKTALYGLRKRVFALGLVHHQLMGSTNLKSFDVAPFLQELSANILEGGAARGVNLSVAAIPLDVGLDFAIPLGLLVTELVTNALKHAFPDGTGNVSVTLERGADNEIILVVSDDGQGTTVGKASTRSSKTGLGTSIIAGLVAQLGGTMTTGNENGTRTEIRVPKPELS